MTNRPLAPGDTVFITGITGFIGHHVALAAADAGYRVVGLHRPTPHHPGPLADLRGHDRIHLRTGDLHDAASLRGHVRDTSPQAICHLGALTSVAYSFDHPQDVHAVNATGTLALAEAAREHAPELEKFVFASSMEVYGNITNRVIDGELITEPLIYTEDMVPKPAAPYAAAKLGAEAHLQVLHRAFGFPAVILRQTNCYGRRYDDYFVVEAFATAMLDADDAVNFGDPRPYRNFIHIDDLTELYLTLLDSDTTDLAGRVHNTGPPNAIQIRELADRLRELTGFDGDINWHTREHRPGEVWCLNSNADRLADAVGWRPTVGLDEGLERVVEYWRGE